MTFVYTVKDLLDACALLVVAVVYGIAWAFTRKRGNR